MYEPQSPELVIVRSRLSPEAWDARVDAARAAAVLLEQVSALVAGGSSLNRAIREKLPRSRRSWAIRRWPRYQKIGFEALFDFRLPREARMSWRVREQVEAVLRAASSATFGDFVTALVGAGLAPLPSPATLKREIARARARFRAASLKVVEPVEVVDLPFAGGELLLAAETETGAIAALTEEVVAMSKEALKVSGDRSATPERGLRDGRGRFTVTYNRERRRKRGEKIASYLRSAAEKAEGRLPSWPRFVREQPHTIDAKLRMLVLEPIISRTQGWAGLRSPEAAGLEPLSGFAYMPSTLAKFTSALAISAAGPRLLAAASRTWHAVATERWAEGGAMAALYVDNHAKEVWSSLFTQSGKISRLNRVMPAITVTYAHTGAGTPLVMGVQSGSAPLAPALVGLVDRAEAALGDGIERAVVIDSEGSTFDILETFAKRGRVVVTPLRPSRVPELELRYTRGSYYRPYRDNDELRIATATLLHRTTGRTLEVGVLLVRREHRDSDTVLVTTGLALGMEGRELADIYFARWPLQENWFKAGVAIGLDRHRGNSARMVSNVAIVTEAERLEGRLAMMRASAADLTGQVDDVECVAGRALLEYERAERGLARRRERFDREIIRDRPATAAFAAAAIAYHSAVADTERLKGAFDEAVSEAAIVRSRLAKLEPDIVKAEARLEKITPRREIRQIDVALDSILTATKLTAAQLITFSIREYFHERPMDTQTFIARVFPVRGRRERRRNEELVVFYANQRDPEMTDALTMACERLNERGLTRGGRRLRYVIEDPAGANS